jgi:hypothetical protein
VEDRAIALELNHEALVASMILQRSDAPHNPVIL